MNDVPTARLRTTRPSSPLSWVLAGLVLTVGCGGRSRAIDEEELATKLAVGLALAPHQDVLVWTTDAEGRESSVWIRGNEHEAKVVAAGPGVTIPVGTEVWQWQETEVAVPLCDCEVWEAGAKEGPCPETLEPGWARKVELVELVSGEALELATPPDEEHADDGPSFIDYGSTAEPIASVGPFLFYLLEVGRTACGAAHGSWISEFMILDLANRKHVEVISPDERGRIEAAEQQTAFELIRDDRLVDVDGAEDLELTVIEPRWMPGGLGVIYQFTAEASYADSDDNWGAYTRSVQVPARGLPVSLLPFALLPEVLGSMILPAGGDIRVGGFGPIAGTDEQVAAILRALSATDEPTTELPVMSQ